MRARACVRVRACVRIVHDMCVCVCARARARVCVRVCVRVYALKIISMDTILRFTNTFIVMMMMMTTTTTMMMMMMICLCTIPIAGDPKARCSAGERHGSDSNNIQPETAASLEFSAGYNVWARLALYVPMFPKQV